MIGDEIEGFVPADRHVTVAHGVVDKRVGQAAMLLELVIRLRHQFFNRVLLEERRRHALAGRFGRHRLDAVFAELEGRRMLAVRPRATRAVEAVRLVLFEQRAVVAARHLFLEEIDGDVLERAPASGGVGVRFDASFGFLHDLPPDVAWTRLLCRCMKAYCVPKTAQHTENRKGEGTVAGIICHRLAFRPMFLFEPGP